MAGNDDPTKPLPVVGEPGAGDPTAPTQPEVAPHVPVADVHTAELGAAAPLPPARRSTSGRLLAGILIAVGAIAAVVIGLAVLGPLLSRGTTPLAPETATPTPVPTETTETTDGADVAPVDPGPAEPEPAPEEPAPEPEPTTPPEPTEPPEEPEPTPEPTP